MKRFWRKATVTAEQGVALDGRVVRTPGRLPLVLPTAALAGAVAGEWEAVRETIDPRTMPLTGLANAAIDRIAPDYATFASGLAHYGESDLLCYRAVEPPELAQRQAERWDPLIGWAQARYDVHVTVTAGIVHVAQPPQTVKRLGEAVAALDAFHLAGFSPIVTLTGSLIGALALLDGAISADSMWQAAHVDEDWQTELWGVDAVSAETRAARHQEFDSAVTFLRLLGARIA